MRHFIVRGQPSQQAASPKLRPCHLLRLPDELLIHITRNLEGPARQKSLHSLSLVNRHLSSIAEEELFYSPTIRPRQTARFVCRILENPKFLKKVINLEIECSGCGLTRVDWTNCRCSDKDIFQWTACEHRLALSVKCREILRARGIKDDSWRWASGLQVGEAYAYIAFIIVITSNLQRLVLPGSYVDAIVTPKHGFRGRGTPIRPYLASSLNAVSQNLKELTILNTHAQKHPHPLPPHLSLDLRSFNMTIFKSVTQLTLPFSGLPEASMSVSGARLLLPPNLNTFQITDCDLDVGNFLSNFLERERGKYTFLRKVEIVFDRINMSHLVLTTGIHTQSDLLSIQKQMEAAGVKISWIFKGLNARVDTNYLCQPVDGPQRDEGLEESLEGGVE